MADNNTSSVKGTSYQTNHTYFFVPKKLGDQDQKISDDTNIPGAMLRLGGYSDIEDTASDLGAFYPREYGTKRVDPDTGQILLSGSGQMLVRAGGKIFINSGDEMDIDSIGDLRINSDGKTTVTSKDEMHIESREKPISVNSGPNQNITLMAGPDESQLGDIVKTAKKNTEKYFGEDLKHVTQDQKSFLEANTYSYTLGNTYSIYVGATFKFTASFNLTVGANADIYVGGSTTYIKVNSNSITAMTFGLTGMDIGITGVSMGKTGLDLKDEEVRGDKSQVKFVAEKVWAGTKTVASAMGSATAHMYGITNFL